jgi:hypothetical protein
LSNFAPADSRLNKSRASILIAKNNATLGKLGQLILLEMGISKFK